MKAFGFHTETVSGKDEDAISHAIDRAKAVEGSAVCIVLDTIKGQGVTYFEEMESNHSVKFNEQDCLEVDAALTSLAADYGMEEL